jgi:hypothetical protein
MRSFNECWESVQLREDEIKVKLYNFSCKILKEATTLNNNAWTDVKMDFK